MPRLTDTEALDRTAFACAAGAALAMAGGIAVAMARVAPPTEPLATAAFAFVAPLLVTAAASRGRLKERLRSVLLGLAGVLVMAVWSDARFAVFAQTVAGALVGTALATDADARRKRESRDPLPKWVLAATAALVAIVWPVAMLAAGSVEVSALARQGAVPWPVLQTAAGALFGLATGLASFPAHLERVGDRVLEALQKARPVLDGELRDLVLRVVDARGRALKLLERSRADQTARIETQRGLDQIALTAIDLADRFSSVDRVLARTPMHGLDDRVAMTRGQLDSARDPGVRRDLERALSALEDQRSQVERLLQGRARLVARLQSELASLEKTEMALALLATGDAAMAGLRLETLGATLESRAHELEAEGAALQETLTDSPGQMLRKIREAGG